MHNEISQLKNGSKGFETHDIATKPPIRTAPNVLSNLGSREGSMGIMPAPGCVWLCGFPVAVEDDMACSWGGPWRCEGPEEGNEGS
jgi:hypothetical protein